MKLRIMPHGGCYGTWFSIQQKCWWGWKELCNYIDTIEKAEEIKSFVEQQK